MTERKLTALIRSNEKTNQLRKEGYLPAVVYGNEEITPKSIAIKVKQKDFENVFKSAGKHSLIDLDMGREELVKVIIKDIQRDVVNNNILSADFYAVYKEKEIVAGIPLEFIGESNAVRNLGGILVKHLDVVKVKCLPNNLVDKIEVNIAKLETLEDSIKVGDLELPKTLKVVDDKKRMIANVMEIKKIIAKQDEAKEEEKPEQKGEEKEAEKK